ncbi:leucine-rich repeat-containing protein 71-like isoform X1 [Cimex lectularius]|uniref:Leucine-rich repeat-containing protein 71 n=1 Tax=Cimex lectularius TaxID=79782 RepID=A0A8I6R7Q0_CIMLE|nr:leucine-rich repeat-containing protein 71-like isoform X1 [Cimex lectularius]
MSQTFIKDDFIKEKWVQICDEELLDEAPTMEYGHMVAFLSLDMTMQEKDAYIEQEMKDQQTKNEEKYKVVVKISPQGEVDQPRGVDVRGILISSQITKAVCSLCAAFDSLKVLRLINCNLKAESIFLLSSLLGDTKVSYLYLDKNPIADQNYHIILKSNFVLQHLSLRMCRIDKKGAMNLASVLMYSNPEHQRLLSLNLNGNLIDCTGIEELARALRWNRKLLYLSLAGNRIADKGAKALAEILLPFQLTYEELVFRAQRISDRLKLVRKTMMEQSQTTAFKKKKSSFGIDNLNETVMSQKRTEVTESISYFIQLIRIADDTTPLDEHPLMAEVEEYDDEYWNKGNDILSSLNLSYNQITSEGLTYFFEVAKYQDRFFTSKNGLTRFLYDGNPVADTDGYLLKGLKSYFSGQKHTSGTKPRRHSRY